VRRKRIAGAALIVGTLSAAAFFAATWLGGERATTSAMPGGSLPILADVDLASLQGSERVAIASSPEREALGVAGRASADPDVAHSCPDVDALVHELASLLEDCSLMSSGYLNTWLPGQANDLDTHCVALLEGFAQDAARRPAEQVACLLLLVECAKTLQVADLTTSQRKMLWQAYDTQLPSPVLPFDCEEDGSVQHRNEIANLAGMCLAVLGDRSDLEQLVERLGRTRGRVPGLAAKSLSHASSAELAELLLARLTDPSLPTGQLAIAMSGFARKPELLQLHPELRARAAQALSERWRAETTDYTEVRSIDELLSILDPALRAANWGEALDRGEAGDNLYFATEALVEHAAPRDLERIDGLLKRGSEGERLAAARAVVGSHDNSTSPNALHESACAALAELVRSSATPSVRRQALTAARKAPGVLAPVAVEALMDKDAGVRAGAVIVLDNLTDLDPDTRARLELVASTDADRNVRKAAAQALR